MIFFLDRMATTDPPIPERAPVAGVNSQSRGHSEQAMMVMSALVSAMPGR